MSFSIPALTFVFHEMKYLLKGIQFVVCCVWQKDVAPGHRQPLKSLNLCEGVYACLLGKGL